MEELQEYIVTLKNKNDLESFYEDMETPGGDLYIPGRAVDCSSRREISRNTHYMLTKEEARMLRGDPRVMFVDVPPIKQGMKVRKLFTQTSSGWDKSSFNSSIFKNWGMLRCFEGQQRTNWGSNGVVSQSGTVVTDLEGKNVDVVIVDGMINPDHPEYAVNPDGTGESRVVQYNWFQHTPAVTGGAPGNYVYAPYTGTAAEDDNNHGAHVAGTVAGNTQGWARKSNIYNINPYSTDTANNLNDLFLIDYIREFHRTKPINPLTGRRNPTICNHSWGYSYTLSVASITGLYYRGQYVSDFTTDDLPNYGVKVATVQGVLSAIAPARYTALDQDIIDAMEDGIIMVGAAANDSTKIDVNGGGDYDNFFVYQAGLTNYGVYYHEGASPGACPGVICVGAVGSTVNETKATFSNCGPRVDIYAPGQNIVSSFNSAASHGGSSDARNTSYVIGKISGTSMASPQVCGVLACALERYPNMTQNTAKEYLSRISKVGQMTDTGGSYTDFTSLQGSENRYLAYRRERQDSGRMYPPSSHFVRPTRSMVFPRTKIRRKG